MKTRSTHFKMLGWLCVVLQIVCIFTMQDKGLAVFIAAILFFCTGALMEKLEELQ